MIETPWPQPSGLYPVGICEFELIDSTRPASFAEISTRSRAIKVMAWYPAASIATHRPRPYLDALEASGRAESAMKMMPNAAARLAMLGAIETRSYVDAPIVAGRFPLLVYCHGFASYIQQNTLLMEHLASHGYVVLALGHPNESSGYFLTDGTAIDMSPAMIDAIAGIDEMNELSAARHGADLATRRATTRVLMQLLRQTLFGHLAQVQADDNIFVIDRFSEGDVPTKAADLAAAVDLGRLGYLGMSYGGHVAALSCMKDPRAKAGVNLDGDFATAEPFEREVGVPFLAMSRDIQAIGRFYDIVAEPTAPDSMTSCDLAYERADGTPPLAPVHRFTLRGGLHWDFLDARFLTPDGLPPGLLGDLPPLRTVQAISHTVQDFFDTYLCDAGRSFPATVATDFADLLVVQDRRAMLARFG